MRVNRSWRAVAAALVVAAAAASWPGAAGAQSGDIAALEDRVARLERDLAELRRLLSSGGGGSEQGATGIGGEVPPTLAARMQVRMGEVEEEMRRITGRLEEMSFKIQQTRDRLDTALSDMEYRLTALEGGTPGAPSSSGSSPPSASSQPEDGTNGGGQPQGTETAAVSLPDGTPSEQYDYAMTLLRQRDFEQAAGALSAFIDANPDSALAGNAYYWLGETYYARGDYDQAIAEFGAGYKEYPDHPKAADSLLKLAMSLGRSERKPQACAAFTELERKYPDAGNNLKSVARQERKQLGC